MNPVQQDQPIDLFINKIDPEAELMKQTKPKIRENNVVFPSILTNSMSQERIDALIQSSIDQIGELELNSGRTIINTSGDTSSSLQWWQDTTILSSTSDNVSPARTFLGKRQLFDMIYYNRIEWRKYVLGNLFAESNRTLPIARRGARQLIARAITNYFSVEPWVKATATNKPSGALSQIDNEIATAGERFFQFKSGEAKLKTALERALERAFVVGECVLKTWHVSKFNFYKTSQTILVNAEGKVILGSDGDFIIEERDTLSPKMRQAMDPVTGEPVVTEEGIAMEEPDVEGGIYLDRDGVTLIPEGHRWEWRTNLARKFTEYSGPTTEIVGTKDFLCAQTEGDIQTAPFICQFTSVSPFDIVAAFGSTVMDENMDAKTRAATTAKYIELLTDMASDGPTAKIVDDMTRPELGETDHINNVRVTGDSRSEVVEVYRTYDADGDGSPEEIMLVLDRKRRKIIYADYLQNVTEDGRRPYTVLTINRVAGRWHGIGLIEQLEELQNSIDYFLNRAIFSSSSSGTSVFFNPEGVTEGDLYAAGGMNLPFNDGQVWHLKKGFKAEDVLKYITVPEVKMNEFLEFMNIFQQMSVNEIGVLGNNDATSANLASAATATGVRDTAAKGEEMFQLITSHLTEGITDTVVKFSTVLFKRMNESESYEWSEGDTRLADMLKRTDVNRMKFFFTLTLTGSKNEQIQTAMAMAMPAVQQWSMQSSGMMEASRPLLERYLKSVMISDAPEILKAMVAAKQGEEQMAAQAAQAQAMQANSPKKILQ